MASEGLIRAVAITAELCGRELSREAAAVFVSDLEGYDDGQVLKALARCRKEVKGMLTIADVIKRLSDGRPDADEAFAMLPWDESQSVVWTDEMRQAFFIALPAYEGGDKVGARMAFKTAYERLVNEARDNRKKPKWAPSLGHSAAGREQALLEAAEKNRLEHNFVAGLLPHRSDDIKRLGGPTDLNTLLVGLVEKQTEGE